MTDPDDLPTPDSTAGARSWTVGYRVRFDEAGPDGFVRPGILLAYAQDCAWIHSTRLGFDRAWYAARGLAWLVRAVRLDLLAPIPSGSELRVRTEVLGFRAASARRRTAISLGEVPVAVVDTDWAMTALDGRPARVPAEILERFAAAGDPPDAPFAPIRLRSVAPGTHARPDVQAVQAAPDDSEAPDETVGTTLVRWSDADPMGHLNNGRALDLVEEAVATTPDGRALLERLPRRYVVEYRASLPVGQRIVYTVRAASPGPGVDVELRADRPDRPAILAVVDLTAGLSAGT